MKKFIILVLFLVILCCSCSREKENTRHIFGATYMTRNNPYFDVLNDKIAEIVEANGDKLIVRDPLQDQEKQNQQIMDMIEEGIEILFLNPVDRNAVQPALEACKKAGVKIINVDTQVKDKEYVLSAIEADHYQAGKECAMDMMKRLKSGKIIILDNPIQQSICQRVEGFLDTIKGNDCYKIVRIEHGEGEIEVSAKIVRNLLKERVEFDVVFGGNDPTALGALAAIQQEGIEKPILIYGIDGSPDVKAMIEIGYMTGTSSQSPKTIGKIAAEVAYKTLAGETVSPYIKLPSKIITRENLSNYDRDGWQ